MDGKSDNKAKVKDVLGKLDHKKVIREVWAHNLKEEMEHIMDLVDDYPYIAMDTEFPGIVARPVGPFRNSQEYHYRLLKCNVDLLKIIQMGLSFCDDKGCLPPGGVCVWQFNFRFDLKEDMYARDSIEFLKKSGIDFDRHAKEGIDVMEFAEVLITSAIVLNDDVKWVTFHSGYDYGYLLRLLTCEKLPEKEADFFDLLKTYCPCVYDVRYLMKSVDLKGGLSGVARSLNIERCGPQHQAGSDSLLTQAVKCTNFGTTADIVTLALLHEIQVFGDDRQA
uniref:poly(A)-specific ribonuclease n=1 Tax=Lotharella globosa TaxID=91324 RepID=A0A7S4DJJ7_9EUKA